MEENQITLLVAIKRSCNNKIKPALKVVQHISNFINRNRNALAATPEIINISALLVSKFFLYYLFSEQRVELIGTVDAQIAAMLERGRRRKVGALNALIDNNRNADEDDLHELIALKNILETEKGNDAALIVCSSIKVYANEGTNIIDAEFDGLMIFPNRSSDQVVFSEAKNHKRKSKAAVICLHDRLQKRGIKCEKEEISLQGTDSFYRHTIPL